MSRFQIILENIARKNGSSAEEVQMCIRDSKETDQKIMVYDLGGGTFDVSVLEIGDGVIEEMCIRDRARRTWPKSCATPASSSRATTWAARRRAS